MAESRTTNVDATDVIEIPFPLGVNVVPADPDFTKSPAEIPGTWVVSKNTVLNPTGEWFPVSITFKEEINNENFPDGDNFIYIYKN